VPNLRHYSQRILNPYLGTIHIVERDNTRAICTDGIHWQLQILEEIVLKPWSELRVLGHSDHYLRYGSWSKSAGLIKIPVHPTLYQENIEQLIRALIKQLHNLTSTLPFPNEDIYECWLFDLENKPVVLLKSSVDYRNLTVPVQAHWYPGNLTDTSFKSSLDDSNQHALSTLSNMMQERLGAHPVCAWIKRDEQRHGTIIKITQNKRIENHSMIPYERFPELLISTEWNSESANLLVDEYIAWQAPLLLMLDSLSDKTRKKLETCSQTRPEVVVRYHRLYPKVIDKILLNKILVEETMRKALI